MSKTRNFCFTTFNTELKLERVYNDNESRIKFIVWQLESCPESKREHFQGYCELANPLSYAGIKRLFDDDTMHIEARKGTASQAREYCRKEESRIDGPWEFGQISNQGKRTDIQAVAEAIKEGKTIEVIAEEHPTVVMKYTRGVRELYNILNAPANRGAPTIEYHWGVPGAGKSRRAHEENPNAYCYVDNPNGWFDGYEGQSCVILDDFEGKMPRSLILKLLDFYPHRMPIKGGHVPIRATRFVITSNSPPTAYYDEAFQRRLRDFGRIIHYQRIEGNEE